LRFRRVFFISQQQAEAMRGRQSAALISITDPDQPVVSLNREWGSVVRVAFHDADPITFPGLNPDMQPMTEDQARMIVSFVSGLPENITSLVVHCKSGISRSAGVAKAVAEAYHILFPKEYIEYNHHVYELMRHEFHGFMSSSNTSQSLV
jgi:predicted protein tyrosine phosphatase